ncbi:MAG: single-stranded DNA-binding protein [Candidatus Cloacimonadaceae bacterium]
MADLRLPRFNKVFISGRIANDLELKFTPKGTPVMRFTVACDRRYRDDSGEWQSATSWIDCVAWTFHAESLEKNARKGSAVLVEGRLETNTWTDQNNATRKQTEIIVEGLHFLEWRDRQDGSAPTSQDIPLPNEEPRSSAATTNDDVPF